MHAMLDLADFQLERSQSRVLDFITSARSDSMNEKKTLDFVKTDSHGYASWTKEYVDDGRHLAAAVVLPDLALGEGAGLKAAGAGLKAEGSAWLPVIGYAVIDWEAKDYQTANRR